MSLISFVRCRAAFVVALVAALSCALAGQTETEVPAASKLKEPTSLYWLNTYGNIRLTDRLFWVAQTHFRFQETGATPFAGQPAQLYNRHALSYAVSSHFNASLGGVLRVNFNTDEVGEDEERAVPEWRIWHEYLWAQHLWRGKIYHRVRLEHRWTRPFVENSKFDFRNRWRYMVAIKMPLNRDHLEPGAVYFGPEAEVILQSGKTVVDSPLEDLRLHGSFGYIASPQFTFAAGLMYSLGQDINDGSIYKQKLTIRTHVYFTPDWRKVKNKLPAIHLRE